MPIIYPGIQVSLDTRQSHRCKGRSLCSFSSQSYFSSHPTNKGQQDEKRKRRYLGRYFAHPMMQNRRAKRDDYKPSAVRVTQRYVP
ncbi:hypothetical protein Psal006b_02851 [Piscirickettsia salmonis]|uniref:Uncharacterized protein n=1 Tax=Piscirickettsia salmonis TaxID=1238 RepID=A0A1L6TGR4_PISSA|nr:hypothetical protein [Piscirickettsia salmonis]AKP72932.2 hypothetical protein PSLF89_860 [Piscirickettsia salmonis LF-89 = ATCC VR-1361]ALB21553.1 hypothetical protein KU39_369 [Piscirickettsia salmonis]ALY01766.1 hypothetical protein AWE47_01865 [Piscirickettsia salmonis]AMA41277.1 hypothetical protein AWJ11_01850 [Piscirickettsia salmonis]AOS36473.1 hypothetical protein AVM72_14840 [Piscirickettsia salmonis]